LTGRLAGRSALVTGGAGGIGAACVLAFLDEGCEVTATGISEAEIAPWQENAGYEAVDWQIIDVIDNGQVDALASRKL